MYEEIGLEDYPAGAARLFARNIIMTREGMELFTKMERGLAFIGAGL
jgi:hypothetical protein